MGKAEIKYDPKNYRKHSEIKKGLIKKSLEECGAGRSIVVDNENVIIAGNGVYEQAAELGLKVRIVESDGTEIIAIKRTDLSTKDERRKLLAMADNRTSDTSEFDFNLLMADFDVDLLTSWDLDLSLFDGSILDNLAQGGFNNELNENSRFFEVTFTFPKSQKESMDKYLKENGKQTIVELILKHIEDA
jgi:hypothetical protein